MRGFGIAAAAAAFFISSVAADVDPIVIKVAYLCNLSLPRHVSDSLLGI
jgi:hypothetical protein